MTYSSSSPPPMPAPEAKLADSKWRYVNSWWVLLPPLSFGFLSWLAFLIPAVRSGKWTFYLFSALYAGLLIASTVLNSVDREGVGGNLAVIILLVGCWLGATIHAVVVNRSFLRALASRQVWYDAPGAQQAFQPQVAPVAPPVLGVSQSDYYAPTAPPPGWSATPTTPPPSTPPSPDERVDVNAVSTETLTAIPGVSVELAQRIIGSREARGGFRDLDALVAAAQLQPHELVRLRDRLVFGPSPASGNQQSGTGRILDI